VGHVRGVREERAKNISSSVFHYYFMFLSLKLLLGCNLKLQEQKFHTKKPKFA
jgi:hypothetical protein